MVSSDLSCASIQWPLAAVFVAAGCVGGCVPAESSSPAASATVRQAIKGGRFDDDHPAVVGIRVTESAGLCTGTLVAANLVITARHCVSALESRRVVCGESTFGTTYPAGSLFVTTRSQVTNSLSDYTAAAEVIVRPDSQQVCGGDLAMLILSDTIPSAQASPIVPRLDAPVVRSEPYTAFGFGGDGGGSGAGVRRVLDGLSVECGPEDCPTFSTVTGSEFLGEDGICEGDSGGPAIDADGRLLGAVSRGATDCRSSIYSAVSGWKDWIRDTAERAADRGGYPPASWVTGDSHRDADTDGVANSRDNCPDVSNESQLDADRDGDGDACDADADGDGVRDDMDNCGGIKNTDQLDTDHDGRGDACDDEAPPPVTDGGQPDSDSGCTAAVAGTPSHVVSGAVILVFWMVAAAVGRRLAALGGGRSVFIFQHDD